MLSSYFYPLFYGGNRPNKRDVRKNIIDINIVQIFFGMQKNSFEDPLLSPSSSFLNESAPIKIKCQGITLCGKSIDYEKLSALINANCPEVKGIKQYGQHIIQFEFQDMDDLIDFNYGKTFDLQMQYIYPINHDKVDPRTNYQEQMLDFLEEQEFEMKEGKLKMKKLTSLDKLINENVDPKYEDTTHVHTLASIQFSEEKPMKTQKPLPFQKQRQNQSFAIPLFQGILFSAIIYGGWKAASFLMKACK